MGKLNDVQKERIHELAALGVAQRKIAIEVGCAQSTVGVVLDLELAERRRARNRDYMRQRYQTDPNEGREKARRRRAADPQGVSEASRRWRQANPGYQREYRRAHPDTYREERRRYSERHAVEIRERRRRYYLVWREDPENMQRMRNRVAVWKRQNPVAVKASIQRRRGSAGKGMDAVDRLLSVEYRKAIVHDPCVYCGAPGGHNDHVHPIVRGGTDHWWNLQRTCQRCNHRKATMTHQEFLEYMQRQGA